MSNQKNNQEVNKEVKKELAVTYEIDGHEVKLTQNIVQKYLVGNDAEITLPEFKMFTELCKARKLNPFLKEAYIIKFGTNPAQIVVGKDAILRRAIKNPQFNGKRHGIIVMRESEVLELNGTFKLPGDVLLGGWAKVYRKNWEHETYVTVSFDEVAQTKKDGTLNSNWATKGATMVEKVAVVRALRETFVEDLGGMIEEDEAWVNKTKETRTTTAEVIEQHDPFTGEITPQTGTQSVVNFSDL